MLSVAAVGLGGCGGGSASTIARGRELAVDHHRVLRAEWSHHPDKVRGPFVTGEGAGPA
jgi:hypothetical protein